MRIFVFAVIAIETFALAQAQEIDKEKFFNAPSSGIIEGLSTNSNNGQLRLSPGTAIDRFGNSATLTIGSPDSNATDLLNNPAPEQTEKNGLDPGTNLIELPAFNDPAASTACPPGQTDTQKGFEGRCVPRGTVADCGPGFKQDAGGKCVPGTACPPGQTDTQKGFEGRCVPRGTVADCGPGFKQDAGGKCVPGTGSRAGNNVRVRRPTSDTARAKTSAPITKAGNNLDRHDLGPNFASPEGTTSSKVNRRTGVSGTAKTSAPGGSATGGTTTWAPSGVAAGGTIGGAGASAPQQIK